MLLFRLAYLFRRPVFEIKRWPLEEIVQWGLFFDVVGPLDWRREDYRDARRVCYRFGTDGDTVRDHVIFPEPEAERTDVEEALRVMENDRAQLASIGDFDNVASITKEIEKLKRLGSLYRPTEENDGNTD